MTVETTNNRKDYTSNGTVTVFPYDFVLLDDTDLDVYLDGVLTASGYTVTRNANDVGGNVTFSVSPGTLAVPVAVLLYRQVPITQPTGLEVESKLPSPTLEGMSDRLTMIAQQLKETSDRSIALPISSTNTGIVFPSPEADLFIAWNPTGDALINTPGIEGPQGPQGIQGNPGVDGTDGINGEMTGPGAAVIGNIPTYVDVLGTTLDDSGYSINEVITEAADPALNGFRLSLHATNPYPSDITSALTVYSIPYKGNRISLWDSAASRMKAVTSGIISKTIAASTFYYRVGYIYKYLNAGVADLEIDWWDSAGQSTKAITLLTIANPCVITCTSHGWNVGDKIGIRRGTASGTAWTDTAMGLDQKEFYISAKTTNTLTLEGCDTSALAVTNYTGATAYKIPATPTTAAVQTEGVWFKSGDRTRRLVGGFMTNGAGTIDDTYYARMLSNVDNLVLRSAVSKESTASYTSPALTAFIPRTNSLALGVTRSKLFNCLPVNAIVMMSDAAEGGTTGAAAIGINRCPNGLTKSTWQTILTAVMHLGYYCYSSSVQKPVTLVAGFSFIQHLIWADGTPYAGENNSTVSSSPAISTNYLG